MKYQPLDAPEGDRNSKKSLYRGVGRFVLEMVKTIALAFVIIVPIRIFLFQPFFVQGASMEPNFEDGQYLIINELGYKETDIKFGSHDFFSVKPFKEIDRQIVLVFRYPLNRKKYFIKRVIGLPGEKVRISGGEVYIYNSKYPNGTVLKESYLPSGLRTKGDITVTLKDDEYFVLGDNRNFSSDSRSWGSVKKKDIIGEVLLRAWPPNKLAWF
jgi:signal peptidase I